MGTSKASSSRKKVDLIRENLAYFDYVEGNWLIPIFHLNDLVRDRIYALWKDALVREGYWFFSYARQAEEAVEAPHWF